MIAVPKIHELQFELIDNPPYLSERDPGDFFLFLNLKVWLGNQRFPSNKKVTESVDDYFTEQDAKYYLDRLTWLEHC